MSPEKAKVLVDELSQVGEERWKELEALLRDMLRTALDRMHAPPRSEVEGLKSSVDRLEQRLGTLEIDLTILKESIQ